MGVWIWGEHGSGSVCSVPQVVRDTGDDLVTMVAAGGFHSTLLAKGSIAAVDQMSPGSSASSLSSYDAITKLLDNVASPQTRNKLKQVIGSQRPLSSVSRSVSQSGETCDTPQSASSNRTQVIDKMIERARMAGVSLSASPPTSPTLTPEETLRQLRTANEALRDELQAMWTNSDGTGAAALLSV